jgi:tRNA 2-thiouridine synthesizing protein A
MRASGHGAKGEFSPGSRRRIITQAVDSHHYPSGEGSLLYAGIDPPPSGRRNSVIPTPRVGLFTPVAAKSQGEAMDFNKELDARGLNCPLPILKTKKALNELTTGQVLKVVSTDAGSVKDMEAFSKQTGNELLGSQAEGKEYVFYIKKK